MKGKWLGPAAILIVLVASFAVAITRDRPSARVFAQQAAIRQISSSTIASGNLAYEEQARLSSELIGRVKSVLVREGDVVRRGQIVLEIEDQSYKAEVAQKQAVVRVRQIAIERARLSLDSEMTKFRRAENLHSTGVLPQSSYDAVVFNLDRAQLDLRTSAEDLRQAQASLQQSIELLAKTRVRAPMDGTVISVEIEAGETTVPSATGIAGSDLMTIANVSSLIAEVEVDESDIARVVMGQRAEIESSAHPDLKLIGTVEYISLAPRKTVPSQSGGGQPRTYSIRMSVLNPENVLLRPGMSCRAEIITAASKPTLAVPVQAIMSDEARAGAPGAERRDAKPDSFVLVIEDGVARRRVVETGAADDEFQEVSAGIKAGDLVIVGPYKTVRYLEDGNTVVVEARSP